MKKLSGIVSVFAFPVTIVSFILMLATDAFILRLRGEDFAYPGTEVIFGRKSLGSLDPGTNASPLALAAWIILLVTILLIILNLFLRFVYGEELEKLQLFISFIIIAALILSAIFMFNVISNYWSANGWGTPFSSTRFGTGWGVAASFCFLAALITLFPIVVRFADR